METKLEKVARAIEDERSRWVGRTNKMRGDGKIYEICRFDDSGFAGSFSEIHGFADYAESCLFMEIARQERCGRAAIEAMADATETMLDAVSDRRNATNRAAYAEDFRAMIDACLTETAPPAGSE